MASKTMNKNRVLLTVILEITLFLLLFDHRCGGIRPGAYQPSGDTANVQCCPKEAHAPFAYSCTVSKESVQSPQPSIWAGKTFIRILGMNKKIPFPTFIKSLPCSATFSCSPAWLPSLPHQGPHTFSINLHCPNRTATQDGIQFCTTIHPLPTSVSSTCQPYPPEAFLSAPLAHMDLSVSQFLGLDPGTWSCRGGAFTLFQCFLCMAGSL